MNKYILVACSVLAVAFLPSLGAILAESPEQVTTYEPQAYGNKYRHLAEMQEIISQLGVTDVEIPRFYGLASQDVSQFLQKTDPMIFQQWEQLGTAYLQFLSTSPSGVDFLAEANTQAILNEIQQRIGQAFQRIQANQVVAQFQFPADFLEWLEQLRREEKHLMVRSSGDEDSTVLANAGGNLSVAYVSPELRDLMKASSQVVASYFGISSLRNRIEANQNPFVQPLKLSVLLQELIGEPIGGATDSKQIPRSLVLFTNEPLYVGDEGFRIMRISTSWGHAEGVVGNLGINSDSVLLLSSKEQPGELYILYDNEKKPQRLVPSRNPTGQVHLEKMANRPDMMTDRVLSQDLLKRLFVLGVRMEQYFQHPATDMEIVVKDGIIYPVQARPVNRPKASPTYLDVAAASQTAVRPITQMAKGKVIVSGLASTLLLQTSQILAVDKLADGESIFNKDTQKLVIVGQDEPANSHPVVNFSSMGVPVIYLKGESYSDLANHFDPARHILVADSQAGSVVLWDKTLADPQNFIKEGYVVHPAPVAISLDVAHPQIVNLGETPPSLSSDLQALMTQIQEPADRLASLYALDALRTHPFVTRLQEWPKLMQTHLKQLTFGSTQGETLIRTMKVYEQKLNQAFDALQGALQDPQTGRLELLFYAKALVALLGEQQLNPNGVEQLAMTGLDAYLLDTEEAIAYEKSFALPPLLTSLLIEKHKTLTPEQGKQWVNFLQALDQAAQEPEPAFLQKLERFQQMVAILKETQALPLWMTFFFHPQAGLSAEQLLDKALQPFDANTEALLATLTQTQNQLDQMHQHIGDFGEADSFVKAWGALSELTNRFIKTNDPTDPVNQIAKASLLGKAVAAEVLKQLVDVYDLSIKTMKASNAFDLQTRAVQVKEMLRLFLAILRSWATTINRESDFAMHRSWDLYSYLDEIQFILGNIQPTTNELRPSPRFSVRAAALGSGTAFERHFPETLEDVFTLIHQNLLVSLASMTSSIPLQTESNLPEIVRQMVDATQSFRQARLIGLQVNGSGITLFYNLPLNNHSSTFQFIFDKTTGQSQVSIQFLGQARRRWVVTRDLAQVLTQEGLLPFAKPPQLAPSLVELSWVVGDRNTIAKSLALIQVFADYSINQDESLLQKDLQAMMKGQGFESEAMANIALRMMKTQNLYLCGIGTDQILELLRANEGYLQAREAALMLSPTHLGLAHRIWQVLLERDMPGIDQDILEALAKGSTGWVEIQVWVTYFQHRPHALQQKLSEISTDLLSSDLSVIQKTLQWWYALIGAALSVEPQAHALVQKLLPDPSPSKQKNGMQLLNLLVQSGFYPDATTIGLLKQRIQDSDTEAREEGLKLLTDWIRRDAQSFPVIDGLVPLLADPQASVKTAAAELFMELIRNRMVSPQDKLPLATALIHNPDIVWAQGTAFELFRELVESRQAYAEALKAAAMTLEPSMRGQQYLALQILAELVNQEQEIPAVIDLLSRMNLTDAYWSQTAIWQHLIEKGYGIHEALSYIQGLLKSPDVYDIASSISSITKPLVQSGQVDEELIQMAEISLQSPDVPVRGFGKELFEQLIDQGKGVLEALNILKKIDQKSIKHLDLIRTLISKGFIPAKDVLSTATAALHSPDQQVQVRAIGLLQEMINRGEGFEEAKGFAKELMGQNPLLAIILSDSLVQKDQGYAVAIEVAAVAVQTTRIQDMVFLWRLEGLLRNLIKKGQIAAVIPVMKLALQNADAAVEIKQTAMRLMSEYFDQVNVSEWGDLIRMAELGIQDFDRMVQAWSRNIFEQLLEKGLGVAEVRRILNGVVQKTDEQRALEQELERYP